MAGEQAGRAGTRGGRALRRLFAALILLAVAAAASPVEAAEPGAVSQTSAAAEASVTAEVDRALAVTTVTGTRMPTPVTDVPAALTVVDRDAIRRSPAMTLDDLLRRQPGFRLFRDQSSLVAHPTTQGASLRGLAPNGAGRALVLVDGLPLNDPFGGWAYWSKVPLVGVERIEVLRGGGSSVWGNGALGGVVQVVGVEATHDFERLHLSIADPGTETLEGLVARRRGDHSLVVEGRAFHTDGYRVLRRSDQGAIDRRASSEHAVLGLRYNYRLSSRSELRLGFRTFGERRSNGTRLTNNRTRALMLRAGMRHKTQAGTEVSTDGFLRWQNFESSFSSQATDRDSESPALDQFDVPSFETGLSAVLRTAAGPRGALSAGADLLLSRGETNEQFFFSEGRFQRGRRAGGQRLLMGLWAEHLYQLSRRLTLTTGLRVDWWRAAKGEADAVDPSSGETTTARDFSDRDKVLVSPKLGFVWDLARQLSLRGALYRGFRAPTINELYRPFRVRNDITAANENLRAETLWGADLGVDWGDSFRGGSLTAFWNELYDPVFNVTLASGPGSIEPCGFVPAGGTCRQRRNLDRVRVRGLEADFHQRLGQEWTTQLGWAFSDAEIVTARDNPQLVGSRLPQVPRHTLVGGLDWQRGRLRAGAALRWSSDRYEDDRNSLELDGYTTVEASASWQLTPLWMLVASVENLLDREIEVSRTSDGVLGLGAPRFVQIGVRYEGSQSSSRADAR